MHPKEKENTEFFCIKYNNLQQTWKEETLTQNIWFFSEVYPPKKSLFIQKSSILASHVWVLGVSSWKIFVVASWGTGTCQNLDTDARQFEIWEFENFQTREFEIWPNLIFLCWQSFELFFWLSQNFRYFSGSDKFPAIFWGLQIFVSHNWILWMKNTQY